MNSQHLCRSLLAVFLLAAAPLVASAQITRVETAGVAQVLRAPTGGFTGADFAGNLGYNTTTNRIHWNDEAGSGFSYFWLDPTLSGNLGGSHNSITGSATHYTTGSAGQLYAGTVSGGTKTSYQFGNHGLAYVPATNSMFNASGNSGHPLVEYQPARSVLGLDIVGEGTSGDMTNSAREISRGSITLSTGEFHAGLAFLGDDGSNYEFLMINRRDLTSQEGVKVDVSKTFSTAPTATASGTRTMVVGPDANTGVGGPFVTSTALGGLVPGVDDFIKDIANDLAGNIYAVSADGTHNYLSAFSLDSIGSLTQIDLDPNSAALHVDLLNLITNNAGTEVAATGLTVNGDASKIYISGSNAVGPPTAQAAVDNIFIFDQVFAPAAVPEPASIAIWSLLGLALAGFCCLRARRKK